MKLDGKVAVVTRAASRHRQGNRANLRARGRARGHRRQELAASPSRGRGDSARPGPKRWLWRWTSPTSKLSTVGLLPPSPSSAPSTCSSATPAFRLCTRSRSSPSANGKKCSPFISMVPFDDQSVPARSRRQHRLYGLGPFEGGIALEGSLRDCKARAHRAGRSRSQGGRQAWRRANVICPGS